MLKITKISYLIFVPAILIFIFVDGFQPRALKLWDGFGLLGLNLLGLLVASGSLLFATNRRKITDGAALFFGLCSTLGVLITLVMFPDSTVGQIDVPIYLGASGLIFSILLCIPRFWRFTSYMYST